MRKEKEMKKETKKGFAPIKILWTKGMLLVHISYANSIKEAEKQITNSKDWSWASARVLFWSERLGQYVTIPEN